MAEHRRRTTGRVHPVISQTRNATSTTGSLRLNIPCIRISLPTTIFMTILFLQCRIFILPSTRITFRLPFLLILWSFPTTLYLCLSLPQTGRIIQTPQLLLIREAHTCPFLPYPALHLPNYRQLILAASEPAQTVGTAHLG